MLCLHSTQLYRRASTFPVSCDFFVNRGTPSAGKGHFIRDKTCCSYVGRRALDHRLTLRSACGNRKRKVRILKTVGGKLLGVGPIRVGSKLAHLRPSQGFSSKIKTPKIPWKAFQFQAHLPAISCLVAPPNHRCLAGVPGSTVGNPDLLSCGKALFQNGHAPVGADVHRVSGRLKCLPVLIPLYR